MYTADVTAAMTASTSTPIADIVKCLLHEHQTFVEAKGFATPLDRLSIDGVITEDDLAAVAQQHIYKNTAAATLRRRVARQDTSVKYRNGPWDTDELYGLYAFLDTSFTTSATTETTATIRNDVVSNVSGNTESIGGSIHGGTSVVYDDWSATVFVPTRTLSAIRMKLKEESFMHDYKVHTQLRINRANMRQRIKSTIS